jgi:(1->4)-alpha-D-glucan 1-alpha-D-glucosylmutase
VKQSVIGELLKLRTREPALFADGDYRPVPIEGPRAAQTIAFARRYDGVELVVALPVRCAEAVIGTERIAPPADWWQETRLVLDGTARDVEEIIGSRSSDGEIPLSGMGETPALVLLRRL